MGGDTGGNDCVHVHDLRTEQLADIPGTGSIRTDTDVVIRGEHGDVCQFTYRGWDAFRLKMADGTFDHIGDVPSPEDIVPIAEAHDWRASVHQEHETNGTCVRCGEQWPCIGFVMPGIDKSKLERIKSDASITWDSGQGNWGCSTCESSDGCAECRV